MPSTALGIIFCCSPTIARRLPRLANLNLGQAPCPPMKLILNCTSLVAPPCQNLSFFFPACTHRRIMLSAKEIFECVPQTASRWGQGICIVSSKPADACARECLVMMHVQKCYAIKCAPDTNHPSQCKVNGEIPNLTHLSNQRCFVHKSNITI